MNILETALKHILIQGWEIRIATIMTGYKNLERFSEVFGVQEGAMIWSVFGNL